LEILHLAWSLWDALKEIEPLFYISYQSAVLFMYIPDGVLYLFCGGASAK